MVETEICHDPVEPSAKAAVESKIMQVAEDAEERLLVNIERVLLTAQQVARQPQDSLVIRLHQRFECGLISILGRANQTGFIKRA